MYGIFTYTYHKHPPNVGKCTIHGWYGNVHFVQTKHDNHSLSLNTTCVESDHLQLENETQSWDSPDCICGTYPISLPRNPQGCRHNVCHSQDQPCNSKRIIFTLDFKLAIRSRTSIFDFIGWYRDSCEKNTIPVRRQQIFRFTFYGCIQFLDPQRSNQFWNTWSKSSLQKLWPKAPRDWSTGRTSGFFKSPPTSESASLWFQGKVSETTCQEPCKWYIHRQIYFFFWKWTIAQQC